MIRHLRLSCAILFLLAGYIHADVAVIRSAGTPAFEEARNGFSSICFENKKEFLLNEDLSNQNDITSEIRSGSYNLVVSFGMTAANFAKNNFSSLPQVFALVTNPDKAGIKGDNITGVSLEVPIKEQFAILKSISKRIKRIGAIYTQPVTDQVIASARTIASDQNLSLVAQPISSSQDIQQAMSELIGKIDALWIPPDPSLNSEDVIRYIGSTSLSKQLPCVGPHERFVRSGAIFSLGVDSVEAGRIAGDLANKILQGTPPNKLPVQELEKPKLIINLRAAGLLGLTIPRNIQDAASKVYQ